MDLLKFVCNCVCTHVHAHACVCVCVFVRRGDGSKDPIVEMRTEEERITNHDGSPVHEPNETTPLTEPE
jgi:hypothetical protein